SRTTSSGRTPRSAAPPASRTSTSSRRPDPTSPTRAFLSAPDRPTAHHAGVTDAIPPEALLADVPAPIRAIAERLRGVVLETVPGTIERVRPGWRLIGYDAPAGRRAVYFAWVFPEVKHAHLGFVHGMLIDDPERRLEGRGITKRARWLTWTPGEDVDEALVADYVRRAVAVSVLPRDERFALAMALGEGR